MTTTTTTKITNFNNNGTNTTTFALRFPVPILLPLSGLFVYVTVNLLMCYLTPMRLNKDLLPTEVRRVCCRVSKITIDILTLYEMTCCRCLVSSSTLMPKKKSQNILQDDRALFKSRFSRFAKYVLWTGAFFATSILYLFLFAYAHSIAGQIFVQVS